MENTVLVTGGLGYIGSHTVVELLNAGHEVVVVDNLSNTRLSVLVGIEEICGKRPAFHEVDVCDYEALQSVFNAHPNIDSVIHFAAYKAVGESVEKPLAYYANNVGGLVNLLEVMGQFKVHSIVFSSSCTVYGDSDQSPITESNDIAVAASPYGNTKIICEDILKDQSAASELGVVSLRYFNPTGAHESALIGELPLGIPSNLVPYLTQTAAGIRKQLTIHGSDYNTPDGTCIRDYIHVVDLAQAHVKALGFDTGSDFHVFNLGTGSGSSVLDIVKTFEKATGQQLAYRLGPRRAGDVEQIWAATDKAKSELGWEAKRDLSDMLQSAWKWQESLEGK